MGRLGLSHSSGESFESVSGRMMGWSPSPGPGTTPHTNGNLCHTLHCGRSFGNNVQPSLIYHHQRLKSLIFYLTYLSQVAKLNASQQIVAPLKMKNRQFLARNLELSARNKQLESGRRNVSNSVSVSTSSPRERDKNKIQQKQKIEAKIHKRVQ